MKRFLFILLFVILIVLVCKKYLPVKKNGASEIAATETHKEMDLSKKNFYEKKLRYTTDRYVMDNIFENYNTYSFDASYLYENLSFRSKRILSEYEYFITKNHKYFVAESNTRTNTGYINVEPFMLIFIADNQNKWLNTNLTLSDKYLIHEMAHAISHSDHDATWVKAIEEILTENGLTDKALLNDLIKDY